MVEILTFVIPAGASAPGEIPSTPSFLLAFNRHFAFLGLKKKCLEPGLHPRERVCSLTQPQALSEMQASPSSLGRGAPLGPYSSGGLDRLNGTAWWFGLKPPGPGSTGHSLLSTTPDLRRRPHIHPMAPRGAQNISNKSGQPSANRKDFLDEKK